jgi:glycerol-3-phosphate dehydrogenase (NAD(P)+)
VLVELARRHGVEMPIAAAVERLLAGAPAKAVAAELLTRPLTAEGPSG